MKIASFLLLIACLFYGINCSPASKSSAQESESPTDALTAAQANVWLLVSQDGSESGNKTENKTSGKTGNKTPSPNNFAMTLWFEGNQANGTATREGENRIRTLEGNRLLTSLVLFELLDGDTVARFEGTTKDQRYRGQMYLLETDADAEGTDALPFDFRIQHMPYVLKKQNFEKADSSQALRLDIHTAWFEMAAPTNPVLRDAFNRVTFAQAFGLRTEFETQIAQEIKDLGAEKPPEYTNVRTLDLAPELIFVHPRLIATRNLNYTYFGGAHPMYGFSSEVFDTQEGRVLTPEELFADKKLPLKFLSAYSYRALKAHFGPEHPNDMLRSGTASDAKNFSTLIPTAFGLLIIFNPYQVGPYAVGAPEVIIPWSELQKNARLAPILEDIISGL